MLVTPPLSILDLSPVPRGGTAAEALTNSIDLARVAERAGYHRYWVAEAHLVPGVASSSTPVLVARPHVMVSADLVVADTDARARELAAPYAQWVLDIRTGRGAQPYVTPEQAQARKWTDEECAIVADRVDTQFVGAPATVVERLATLARVTGAAELLVTTITTEHADRVRSTELLAAAWATHASRAA